MTRRPDDQAMWGRRLRRWPEAEQRAPSLYPDAVAPFEVWRSRDFFVQFFAESDAVRMTVNRTHAPNGVVFADGITWDDLQRLKSETGRGDAWAIEIYPPDDEVVNDANMRHFWLLDEAPVFAWREQVTEMAVGQ